MDLEENIIQEIKELRKIFDKKEIMEIQIICFFN